MKKSVLHIGFKILCLALTMLLFMPVGGRAQWLPSGATSGPIYYNGGNVGIGTSSPPSSARLSLFAAGGQMFQLWDNGDATHYRGQEAIYASTSETMGLVIGISPDIQPSPTLFYTNASAFIDNTKFGPLYFGTNNTPRVTIDANGNLGVGTTTPAFRLDVAGNANFSGTVTGGNIVAKYQDVAEWVPADGTLSAGTVVVVKPDARNRIEASAHAYDTRVAGVVSAQPGISLGEAAPDRAQIATTGRVKVRVDATYAPIHPGDVLVSSDVPGTAMKSEPIDVAGIKIHRPGTIIGKALEPLDHGSGEILVLLSLQ